MARVTGPSLNRTAAPGVRVEVNTLGTAGVSRDEQLLKALHAEHASALWNYVTGLLHGDRIRAQDVVQETLLRAWQHPNDLERASSPRGWLYTVAKRIVIDDWRAAARRPEAVSDHVPEQAVDDLADGAVNRRLVIVALQTLTHEHREILLETYFGGRSVSEAARSLGIAEGTVKSRTHYALHARRAAITDMGGPA